MVLERLGSSLHDAIKKVFRAPVVDAETVRELVRDIQRALLQADVNVKLVLEISKEIEKRALEEKVPPGISRKEHVIKVVYEEITRFLGEKPVPIRIVPGKRKVLMLVGIQGSGKTTSATKLAKYFQRRGLKTALVCADTYRPGAYAQLQQMANQANIPVYGDTKSRNPEKIAIEGLGKFDGFDLVLIDTAGRHKEEKGLLNEMKKLEKAIKPDEVILVIDGTIGQQAAVQASAFHKATPIGAILVAKLDGTARGGGAISAVASIGSPIKYIGVGEKIDDIETFIPSRFVGRLLGMGDLESLVEKVREAEIEVPEKKMRAFLSGKFTLSDMYEQFESIKNLGPLKRFINMIPGFTYNIPEEMMDTAEETMKKWRAIIQSLTPEERENPRLISKSRVKRVAHGSGTDERDVKEMLKRYNMLKKMMKTLRRKRLPFFGKKLPIA